MNKSVKAPDVFVVSEENFLENIESSMMRVTDTCCGMFVTLPSFFGELKEQEVLTPLKNGLKSAVFAKVTENYKEVSGNRNISDSGVCAVALTLSENAVTFLDNITVLLRVKTLEVPTVFMMIYTTSNPSIFKLNFELHDTKNGMNKNRPPLAHQTFELTIHKDLPMTQVLSSLINQKD